jgi:hypothetical protein
MMTLAKPPLAIAGVVVLGLALTGINAARHVENKSQPAVKPPQIAVSAHPQGSSGQPLQMAQAADRPFPASPPSSQAWPPGAAPPPGYRTAPDGYMPGDMSDSIYGSLTGPDTAGPVVYWAPGRWYPYPGFGDKRVFMPPPQGVWGR